MPKEKKICLDCSGQGKKLFHAQIRLCYKCKGTGKVTKTKEDWDDDFNGTDAEIEKEID